MAENAALRESDPETFYKKCNEWDVAEYSKKNLRAALGRISGFHFEALITLAWEQIQVGKRNAGAAVNTVLDYKPKVGPERKARTLAEEGLRRHAEFPLAREGAGQQERRFFQTTLAKALVRFANERQKHIEKSEVEVKEEKGPSEEPDSDVDFEDTDPNNTPRKRHQQGDLRLLSSPSSERCLFESPPPQSSRAPRTMPPQTLNRTPQQVLFLLVARAANRAHIFRLQMRHLYTKDNLTAEDMTLEPITKEVEASGFEAPKQKQVRYVYVRKTGENDPVYNDRTLQAAFQEFLMHEDGATQFTLFIEDRDGDPFGLPALKCLP